MSEETDFTKDVEANGQFDHDDGDEEDEAKTEVKSEQQEQEQEEEEEEHSHPQQQHPPPLHHEDDDGGGGPPGDDSHRVNHIPKGTDDNAGEDRKLFVGGLSWETREPQLMEYFEKFGEIESVNLKLDPMTGKSRCFAFVVYKESSDLNKVFAAGDHAINSKKVDVKKARAKPGKIFVGGLKPEMTDEQIREYFEQFGNIIEFDMPFDKLKKQRKGFGFITFEREETMKELIKKGKVAIGEHEVDLRKATPKPDYNAPFRGGGGYGPPAPYAAPADYYGYGDYYGGAYGGGGGAYADYYTMGYGGYGGAYGAMPPAGGGKMRGGGVSGGVRGGAARRGGEPY